MKFLQLAIGADDDGEFLLHGRKSIPGNREVAVGVRGAGVHAVADATIVPTSPINSFRSSDVIPLVRRERHIVGMGPNRAALVIVGDSVEDFTRGGASPVPTARRFGSGGVVDVGRR